MTPPNFALCFTYLLMANMAQTTSLQQSSIQFKSANVGGRVTLPCLCQDDLTVMFYWYKQSLGQKPKPVSIFYKHDNNNIRFQGEFENNPRFSLDTGIYKNHLTISDLHISDSATYYCVKRNVYDFEFCEGTTVNVKDTSSTIQALVHQSVSETMQPGDSVTLNCTVQTGTCDGEHSVYWFKDSEEPHPGIIYTHGDRNDQCERKPDTQTHTCVYNLPMKNLNLSHAENNYCAVASCRHILFGDGKTVDFEDNAGSFVLVHFLSGALAFTTILVVLLAFSAYKMYKRKCQCTDVSTPNTELHQDEENLHYVTLRDQKINRARRERDDTWSECVYSTVKQ